MYLRVEVFSDLSSKLVRNLIGSEIIMSPRNYNGSCQYELNYSELSLVSYTQQESNQAAHSLWLRDGFALKRVNYVTENK